MNAPPVPTDISKPTLAVLLAVHDAGETYGLPIVRSTGLPAGSVYRILKRLAATDWLSARAEDVDPFTTSRPARVYYRLTDAAQPAVESLHALYRMTEEQS